MERETSDNTEPRCDFEAVMAAHEGALLRYATGLLRDAHAAQDVVQNAFIKLFRRQPQAGGVALAAVRAWLFRVTHNEAIDYLRHKKRVLVLHEGHGQEEALRNEYGSGKEGTEKAARMELVLQCVDQLDVAEREVLLLRLQEGLSYEAISRVTGRTEGNIGCLLHHAVRKTGKMVRQMDEQVVPGRTRPLAGASKT